MVCTERQEAFAFNFQGDVCTIQTPGGKVLQIPRDTDNLYRLSNIEEITVDNAAVTDAENILNNIPIRNTMAYHITIVENAKVLGFEKLKLLHRTLGHRGTYSSLAKAIKTGLLDVGKAFRFNVNKIPHEKCDTCAQVKARKYAMRRQIHSSQLRPGECGGGVGWVLNPGNDQSSSSSSSASSSSSSVS